MNIKRSTLYYWTKDNPNKKIKETDIKNKIATISYKHPYYGYRRMTAPLKREKVIVNHKRVLRMMRELGIQGLIKRKYISTTNSKHNNKIYPNLIKDKELSGINQSGVLISPISGHLMVLSTWRPSWISIPAR